jgi:hypothetical protein
MPSADSSDGHIDISHQDRTNDKAGGIYDPIIWKIEVSHGLPQLECGTMRKMMEHEVQCSSRRRLAAGS